MMMVAAIADAQSAEAFQTCAPAPISIAFTNASTAPAASTAVGAFHGLAMCPLSMRWIQPAWRVRELKMMYPQLGIASTKEKLAGSEAVYDNRMRVEGKSVHI